MPSTVTNYSSKININYPEVGKDNDSQGFRDNFYNIQAALLVASNEITELQENSVKLTQENDFNFNTIKNAVLQNTSELAPTTVSITTASSYHIVDYSAGTYHRYNITYSGTGTYASFEITNWPATDLYGSVKIQVNPANTSTCTFNIAGGAVTLLGSNSFPRQYNQIKPVIYEAWTTDNGANVYVVELTSV